MDKASSCFICGQQFDFGVLIEHEKTCLENIKANDVQYTRQNTEEHASSISSRPESLSLSNHSASSNESYEKKYLRCYICGTDVPTYLKGIHEKACKKNWEAGLLNADRKTNVRADMFRSLSRGSSRTDLNADQPKPGGLRKAKSSTLYRRASCNNALTISNDDLTANKNSKSATNLSKNQTLLHDGAPLNKLKASSQSDLTERRMELYLDLDLTNNSPVRTTNSVTNLKLDIPVNNPKPKLNSKTKSLQDLRKRDSRASSPSTRVPTSPTSPIPPSSPSGKPKTNPSSPQYVVCHLCGKLYSQHSIVIHVKQCEKTRALQRTVGTNVDYKIKSRSLADLSKGKLHASRANSVSNLASPSNRTPRPSTARPANRLKQNASLSSSMDNLSFHRKRGTSLSEPKKKENGISSIKDKPDFGSQNTLSNTPGLQKCYLCGQLYGTRSLPIHQKQCYVKQERLREQEAAQTKKKKKRDIKLLPFGKPNISENPSPGNQSKSSESPMRPYSTATPSSVFGVENGIRRKETLSLRGKNTKKEMNGDIEKRSTSSSVSSEPDSHSPRSPASPISVRDLMMTCVHCGCQCEPYTMAIHEKVCRKLTLDSKSAPEIKIENAPDQVSSNGMDEKITNGGLIHCEGCDGEFFSSEIFQHRINCRTSTL